jgi:hypothetical protein
MTTRDGPLTVLTFRMPGLAFHALCDAGPRFFQAEWGTRWQTKVAGMALDNRTDWKEVDALVVESYRLLAPKKLVAVLSPSDGLARASRFRA